MGVVLIVSIEQYLGQVFVVTDLIFSLQPNEVETVRHSSLCVDLVLKQIIYERNLVYTFFILSKWLKRKGTVRNLTIPWLGLPSYWFETDGTKQILIVYDWMIIMTVPESNRRLRKKFCDRLKFPLLVPVLSLIICFQIKS